VRPVTLPEHRSACVLGPVHWLPHAAAAAGHLANLATNDDAFVDRTAAGALADTLAYFAELEDRASVTLADVAKRSNLVGNRFDTMCTGGATP